LEGVTAVGEGLKKGGREGKVCEYHIFTRETVTRRVISPVCPHSLPPSLPHLQSILIQVHSEVLVAKLLLHHGPSVPAERISGRRQEGGMEGGREGG